MSVGACGSSNAIRDHRETMARKTDGAHLGPVSSKNLLLQSCARKPRKYHSISLKNVHDNNSLHYASDDKTPIQRMPGPIEAMTAASELVNEDVRGDFFVFGDAALIRYGSSARKIEDVDIDIQYGRDLDCILGEGRHKFSIQRASRQVVDVYLPRRY